MPGTSVVVGPFVKGLHNSAGTGEYIDNQELFDLVNLEVDTDGSLANRPAINNIIPLSVTPRCKIIGTYISDNDTNYLVISYGTNFGTTGLMNAVSGSVVVSRSVKSNVAVQYNGKIWIVPASDATVGTGGYWDSSATPVWTGVSTMPRGDDACIYKDRLCVTMGLASTTNNSTLFVSMLGHPETWFGDVPGSGNNDAINVQVEPGNGQRLVSCLVMNSDLILFKEHSTFRWIISGDPKKAELSKISSTIGTPTTKCAVTYDNNNIYLLHDNSVYELYNYTFTKISDNIAMTQEVDSSVYSDCNYGLTLFRDRLFVRYYKWLYVFSLDSNQWSRWVTGNKFSTLFVIPNVTGMDVAYGHSVTSADPLKIWTFIDDRVTGVSTVESFNCSITTKTMDFDVSSSYKVLFWWGMTIATITTTDASVSVPNAGTNYTWDYLKNNYTWQSAKDEGIKWSMVPNVVWQTQIPAELGHYARKFLKFNKKIRFRQAYFTISTAAGYNSIGDACVRIYDLTAFVLKKETVSRRTT